MYQTKKDYLVQAIKNSILSGEIKPGAPLRQRDLAKRFDTSVTPVREALQQLESEGIVTYLPHRGASVISVDQQDVVDVSIVRAKLEEFAIELALPHVTKEVLVELREVYSAMEVAFANEDWARLRELNHRFHFRIYELGQNPHLVDVIEYTWHKLPWDVVPTVYEGIEDVLYEHAELLEALEARDQRAKQIIRRHILNWVETMKDHIAETGPSSDGQSG